MGYGYDNETIAQSSQWVSTISPRPKKAQKVRSNVEVMLTVFFYYEEVVYHEFLPRGQMVNKEYYMKAVRRKRPDLGGGDGHSVTCSGSFVPSDL